ncbi:hypothetical protein DPMN_165114 [Dreissena polymorpha]|uniref:Uncharacterized protein n=1 Tax=Dreissena polymorpha TaxID=45954 RepID=A0A9D4IUB3_DREPO|nr:hypothetical protein DPMN_165114 [Dreissena polymorpha]
MKSTKALPRYGSGHKSASRTDGKTEARQRQNNIPLPMAGDNKARVMTQEYCTSIQCDLSTNVEV